MNMSNQCTTKMKFNITKRSRFCRSLLVFCSPSLEQYSQCMNAVSLSTQPFQTKSFFGTKVAHRMHPLRWLLHRKDVTKKSLKRRLNEVQAFSQKIPIRFNRMYLPSLLAKNWPQNSDRREPVRGHHLVDKMRCQCQSFRSMLKQSMYCIVNA